MKVPQEYLKLATGDENVADSPFEGCEALRRLHGVVPVPDWSVLSRMGQPPGS